VARDVLYGLVLGLVWTLVFDVRAFFMQRLGSHPTLASGEYLLGARRTAGAVLAQVLYSGRGAVYVLFLFFLVRAVVRRPWPTAAVFALLLAATKFLGSDYPLVDAPAQLVIYAVAAAVVVRFGLVALATGLLTADLLLNVPITANLGSWYAGAEVLVFALLLALAGWAFRTSLGGRPLWKAELLD